MMAEISSEGVMESTDPLALSAGWGSVFVGGVYGLSTLSRMRCMTFCIVMQILKLGSVGLIPLMEDMKTLRF